MQTKRQPERKVLNMAAKTKKTALAKTPSPEEIQRGKGVAKVTLHPIANAAAVIAEYGKPFGDPSIDNLMDSLAVLTCPPASVPI